MRTEKLLVGIIVLAAASCGDGLGGPYPEMNWGPASNSLFKPSSSAAYGVLGDWFPYKDKASTVLSDNGLRFTAEGSWNALDAPGDSLEAGEHYCVEQGHGSSGTYTISGQTLTLQSELSKGIQRLTFELQGMDAALVTAVVDGQTIKAPMRRINPPRSSGSCQDYQPTPVPMP
jgi:hypothetical protein